MKTLEVNDVTKESFLVASEEDQVIVTRNGNPIGVYFGIHGLDQEQIELGLSDKFWKLMEDRGKEPRVSLEEVEKEFGIVPTQSGE